MRQVGCNWGALLQLKLPFPTRLSSPFPCHPLQMRHTTAGRDATSSASCPTKVRVAAHGPESRFPPQQSRPLSGLRASVGFKPNVPSLPARTRRASPTPQAAKRGDALPCPADTLRSSLPLSYIKAYRPHKILLSGKNQTPPTMQDSPCQELPPRAFSLISGADPCRI